LIPARYRFEPLAAARPRLLATGATHELDNLRAAVALHGFHDNFCRVHSSIRCTPAMRAKLTERIWTLGDLFGEAG
jgi:hypothetical protein